MAIIVVALLLTGVIPGFRLGGKSGGGPAGLPSEQTAASAGQSFANGVAGGPWSLELAQGIDSTLGSSIAANTFTNVTCPFHGSGPTRITVPGYNGSYSTGLAGTWFLVFSSQGSAAANLLLLDQSGTVTEIGELTGTVCARNLGPALPSGLVDSSSAAQVVGGTSNASAYVAAHPHSNATYYLYNSRIGPGGSYVPIWDFTFFGCSGHYNQEFDAGVYATNGTVLFTQLYAPVVSSACTSVIPLGTGLAIGNPAAATCPSGSGVLPGDVRGCAPGDFEYTVTVESSTIELGDFELTVATATGTPFSATGAAAFAIVNVSGLVVASYLVSSGAFQMTASWQHFASGISETTPLTTLVTITIDMGQSSSTAGLGLVLEASGTNGYAGTVQVTLP